MKRIMLLFLAAIMCTANMCNPEETENYHRTVKVTNNAEYPIYVAWELDTREYPWGENKAGGIGESKNRVNPGETNTAAMMTARPTDAIETMGPDGHMKVYFLDSQMFDQIPVGSPIPNEVLLDSRVYDLEDLRAIGFHIQYPLEVVTDTDKHVTYP